MTRVHDAFPSKHAYWTEGGPDISHPDYATDWTKWSSTFAQILKNWARCIVSWNLVLDEKGSPNIGPFACGGVVTVDSKSREITRSGQYWAFAHYSKVIQRGAQVIASHSSFADLEHVALKNTDGSHVLVVSNQGAERQISCRFAGQALELKIPHDSVTTLLWS
jgi:glucosylceramidase